MMLQGAGREKKGGEGLLHHSHSPITLLTVLGGWREGTRKRERVSRVSKRESVCARGLHHRIPFTESAGGHALMERIRSIYLTQTQLVHNEVIPDVTDKVCLSTPSLSRLVFITERL